MTQRNTEPQFNDERHFVIVAIAPIAESFITIPISLWAFILWLARECCGNDPPESLNLNFLEERFLDMHESGDRENAELYGFEPEELMKSNRKCRRTLVRMMNYWTLIGFIAGVIIGLAYALATSPDLTDIFEDATGADWIALKTALIMGYGGHILAHGLYNFIVGQHNKKILIITDLGEAPYTCTCT